MSGTSAHQVTSLHLFLRELEARSPSITRMGLTGSLKDALLTGKLLNVANSGPELDRVARAVEMLVSKAGVPVADAEVAVRQLVTERHFYGSYCELGAYDWLNRHHIAFTAQVKLTGSDVLNPNGCTIDGSFDARGGYFDIKGMGFQAYVAEQFRMALQQRLRGLQVVIEGAMDVAVRDIETLAFPQLPTFAQVLANGGIAKLPELGWTIRANQPQRVTMTAHTINPYRLAEENRYYPLKTASQFTRHAPFVLVFAYAAQFNLGLFLNYSGSTEVTLRAMTRRAFMQLAADSSPASGFDNQVAPGVTVADAVRLISGHLFINLDNDKGWLFLNPRATHQMSRYHVEQLFDFNQVPHLGIDDFAHDDY